MILYSNNYSKDIVLAGILHDLLEDTDVKANDIELKYGSNIRKIVEAVSFNPKIDDKLKQAKFMFENCCNQGYEALIVKCADLLDNIDYVNFVTDLNIKNKLLKKYELFLGMSRQKNWFRRNL